MIERPKVVVTMPRYGDVSMGAARGFCAPSTTRNVPPEAHVDVVAWCETSTSATPSSFNNLLAMALGYRDDGIATHFAMIHSDIDPHGAWVNVLWNEMRRHDAAVMTTVIPIKNMQGKTSTAVGSLDDPWRIRRYIMQADRSHLPDTFGQADVCGDDEVLLVNTGLWLADLRHEFWDSFSFRWFNRILKKEDGTRECQFRPEDWEMSRELHAAGLKVMATWLLPVTHHGAYGYENVTITPETQS